MPNFFPNSTSGGQAIPFDILLPAFAAQIAFASASATSFTLPTDARILLLRATENCFIKFGGTAVIPTTTETDMVFVGAGEVVTIAAPASGISILGQLTSGTLIIQGASVWNALGLPSQYNRG